MMASFFRYNQVVRYLLDAGDIDASSINQAFYWATRQNE